ncbi:hypothetical protein EU527_03945 [Candidatus Thorarchaeota archaeon]|nr:MAG: hypothetical protein EU527_03945 [Candidatus Thorarchaeota archaeon]
MKLAIGQLEPQVGHIEENLSHIIKILDEAERASAEVLVLPELCNSGYVFKNKEEAIQSSEVIPEGPMCTELCYWSSKDRLVVAGICEKAEDGLYNSAVAFGNGRHITTYRKAHLFLHENSWFLQGMAEPPVFHFKSGRFGIMICFDWAFPEMARILALKKAQVVLHPANLVLPYCQDAMITRSIENKVFTATANRVGNERGTTFSGASQITDPFGHRLVQMSSEEIGVRVIEIDPTKADNKAITERNDVLEDRRPNLYKRLIQDD